MTPIDRRRGLLDDVPVWAAAEMDAWADWVKQCRDGPSGGGASTIWFMMEAHRLGIWATGTTLEPVMPEHIAAVDTAVGRLEKPLKKAFLAYYMQYARAQDKAHHCHCNVAEFYRRLKRARRTVADLLENARISA